MRFADWLIHQSTQPHWSWFDDLAWHPDEDVLACASGDTSIGIIDPLTGELKARLEGHVAGVRSVSFSADGRLLASKADDGRVMLWSTGTWKLAASWADATGHEYWPPSIRFNPSHPELVTFGDDNRTLRIWSVDSPALQLETPPADSVRYTSAKIVLVGDSGVGKTGLGWRVSHGEFMDSSSGLFSNCTTREPTVWSARRCYGIWLDSPITG
jgi:WD40 repeat protein